MILFQCTHTPTHHPPTHLHTTHPHTYTPPTHTLTHHPHTHLHTTHTHTHTLPTVLGPVMMMKLLPVDAYYSGDTSTAVREGSMTYQISLSRELTGTCTCRYNIHIHIHHSDHISDNSNPILNTSVPGLLNGGRLLMEIDSRHYWV